MRVSELMSDHVLGVTPGTSIRTVARIMVRERIGSVCVLGEHDELIGLITEADLIRLELHRDPTRDAVPIDVSSQEAPLTAAEVMTTNATFCTSSVWLSNGWSMVVPPAARFSITWVSCRL